ncbi:T9SS type A sorting domain-containing protein [Aquimarina sp. AU119]|uniref:T9SS type A sorting domain-containing protein n=1 Tax=Aquimarina sp. AU119 TaxID=2108528 RepID=UPI000D68D5A2|nr:T9SS type A sorting domain-containing protein [Aquimarina sp. AU119]
MNNFCKKILIFIFILNTLNLFSQTVNVSIDLEKQRFLGEESNLDRSKYFNLHNASEEPAFPNFLRNNNFGFGRRFFDPHSDRSFVNPVGNYPNTPPTSDGIVRPVRRFIATSNPKNSWKADSDPVTGALSAARYFVDEVDNQNRPEYWEPFNEPFIKANNFIGPSAPTGQAVVRKMSEWFRDMAKGIHDTPELAKMKVIGFSSAFPSYARRDFSETWQNHMKLFIDVAGAEIDALSVHPYDGVNQIGQSNGRSGSNSEAILDLLEAYTNETLGAPKKLAITEFGVIERGFPPGPAPGFYNESASAITINGLNSMLFNFFERQDNIEICIPFITGRADFWYQDFMQDGGDGTVRPYTPAYLRPTELLDTPDPQTGLRRNNEFVLTFKENFFKFWKDLKGDRAKITSDNLDVQVQAFVDGNKAYVVLNNLDSNEKTVNLDFLGNPGTVLNVNTSFLVIDGQNTPIYESGTNSNSIPSNVTLRVGETRMFKIIYDSPVQFTSSIVRKKYYATSNQASMDKAPTVVITANQAKTFILENIVKGASGNATLRLGVGIPLTTGVGSTTPTNLDRLPSQVTFNGTSLPIPSNWKGYDQTGRIDFFGVIELDVPHSIINNGTNTVTVTYTKAGGRIASVILSLETDEAACTPTTLYADEDGDGLGNPAVTIQSCGPVNGFVDNNNDQCIDDVENLCIAAEIPGIIQAEEYTDSNGVNINGNVIDAINDGDSSTYNTNVIIPGSFDISVRASTPSGGGGVVTIFNGTDQLATINITDTGGLSTFQDFQSTVTISKPRLNRLRFEYSGATGIDLFTIDSFEFTTNEAFVRYDTPESNNIALTIGDTQTSFSIDVNYATLKSTQSVDLNLRTGSTGVTGGFASIRPGAVITTTGTLNVNLSGPLPIGEYEMLIFINSPGDDPQFFGGPSPQLKLKVIGPPIAGNDQSTNNNPGNVFVNILDNDTDSSGATLASNNVTVDLDPNTVAIENTLSAGFLGDWRYDPSSGGILFIPNSTFSVNPPAITYKVTETGTGLSDTATVTVTYAEFTLADFTVKNIGESCASENNGRIEISTQTIGDYSYQLNGSSKVNFTGVTAIENLDAGSYNLVITDNNSQDILNFDLVISEPEKLETKTKVLESDQLVVLELSGSDTYKINLNGNTFTTEENKLTLPLENGTNTIEVVGKKECQGKFTQKIIIGNSVIAYPNPVQDNLTIKTNTTDNTNIKIFDISGKLLISQSSVSASGIYQVNVQDLASGIYFVSVNATDLSSTFKIIK